MKTRLPLFYLPARPVTAVRRCSRRPRGSITADHVARGSAIPAPATGCRCQREAGAASLSGCVRRATDREGQLILTARVRQLKNLNRTVCVKLHQCLLKKAVLMDLFTVH